MNSGISIILKKNQLKMSLNFLSQLSLQVQGATRAKTGKKRSRADTGNVKSDGKRQNTTGFNETLPRATVDIIL